MAKTFDENAKSRIECILELYESTREYNRGWFFTSSENIPTLVDENYILELLEDLPPNQINFKKYDFGPLLIVAMNFRHMNVAKKILLEFKDYVDPNISAFLGNRAICIAVKNKNEEILEILLQYENIEVNYYNLHEKLIHCAISGENNKIINMLLEHKNIDINIRNFGRRTPLHLAIEKRQYKVINKLLTFPNININAQDMEGNTPLMECIRPPLMQWIRSHLECIRMPDNVDVLKLLLKNNNIDVNMQDSDGYTALMLAAQYKMHKYIKLLLKVPELNINIEDKSGFTALMIAVFMGCRRKTIELLIEYHNINNRKTNGEQERVLHNVIEKAISLKENKYYNGPKYGKGWLYTFAPLIDCVTEGYDKTINILLENENKKFSNL